MGSSSVVRNATSDFDAAFKALTGHAPFPWQRRLYERFVAGDFPSSCALPTGLGKTSVVAVWLLTLAKLGSDRLDAKTYPRRLVYVVNRRTVVDQTTAEVEKYRQRLVDAKNGDVPNDVANAQHILNRAPQGPKPEQT